jgi:sodium/bile acid cotransporter 7
MSTFPQSRLSLLRRLIPDAFTISLVLAMLAASFWPAGGMAERLLGHATTVAIGLLFFLHGAKLSGEAAGGLPPAPNAGWAVLALFPLLGLLPGCSRDRDARISPVLSPHGPSRSVAIAFTAGRTWRRRSASVSNRRTMARLILHGEAGHCRRFDRQLRPQLLLPRCRPSRGLIGGFIDRNKALLRHVDRWNPLVVYAAFSEGRPGAVAELTPAASSARRAQLRVKALALIIAWLLRLGFSKEDQIAIVFCGSKKSMASGVPMAKVLFATSSLGVLIVPLMLFHQIQLMACAMLAQHYARRPEP